MMASGGITHDALDITMQGYPSPGPLDMGPHQTGTSPARVQTYLSRSYCNAVLFSDVVGLKFTLQTDIS